MKTMMRFHRSLIQPMLTCLERRIKLEITLKKDREMLDLTTLVRPRFCRRTVIIKSSRRSLMRREAKEEIERTL
jgi:hypothetical protein